MRHTTSQHARRAALVGTTIALAATLTGCASSNGTRLGLDGGTIYQDNTGVGDALGASMFREHVRLAAAETRRDRLLREHFAAVNVPVD